jgi:SAM-dependent methyltransferase
MSTLTSWLDKKWYPDFQKNWDDELFRKEIVKELTKDKTVLDLGAGAGIVSQMNIRGLAKKVCGIDPDNRVVDNPYLDEGKVAVGENIPYPDESFDLIFADNVLEHLENPMVVFQEIARVLKPGGLFLAKTPNKWHYMPVLAQLTPHWFHQLVNRLRGRNASDTFPTLYRVNSPKNIQHYASKTGFSVEQIQLIEGRPEYLRMTALTYLMGYFYEKLVNAISYFSRFRILLVIKLKKNAS